MENQTLGVLEHSVEARRVSLRHRLAFALMLSGSFMNSFDGTAVNLAAPSIGRSIHASSGVLQLAITAYTLVYGAGLITGARLGGDHGYRRIFLIGTTIFSAASLGIGLAQNSVVLVGMRTLQGVGAALMGPQIISLIQSSFTGKARSRALGALGAAISLGATCGLVASGAIIDLNLFNWSWRTVFCVNVPIGVVIVVGGQVLLPASKGAGKKLDLVGVALLVLGAALITVPLSIGRQQHWPIWSLLSFGVGLCAIRAFIIVERRVAQSGGAPVLDLAVFHSRNVRPGLLTLALSGNTYSGILFCIAAFLQDSRHASAFSAALPLVPFAFGFGVSSAFGSKISRQFQHFYAAGGLLVLGSSLLALAVVTRGGAWPQAAAFVLLGICGLGYGAVFSTIVGLVAANVMEAHIPEVSGLCITTNQFSFVLGVTVYGSIFFETHSISFTLTTMAAMALLSSPLAASIGRRRSIATSAS